MRSGTRTWVVATRPSVPPRRTTITDVAREAGVDKATVSRALRGMSGVRHVTRERIVEAADRLHFPVSRLTASTGDVTSKTVGIVLPTLDSWYFLEVAAGTSDVLSPAGFRVELINLDVDSDDLEVDSPQFAGLLSELGARGGRDALIYACTVSVDPGKGRLGEGHVPASVGHLPLTSVPGSYTDNRAGGRLIGEHLISLGHRHVAVLDGRLPGKSDNHVWNLRTAGLRDALREDGLQLRDSDVYAPGGCYVAHGERGMQMLLGRDRPLPTAVFCHTDEMAFGAIAALRRARIRCPEDMSVAGFDGHPMSRYWGLTTVDQHARGQGHRAARALIAALNNALDGEVVDDLRIELAVGETTGHPSRPAEPVTRIDPQSNVIVRERTAQGS